MPYTTIANDYPRRFWGKQGAGCLIGAQDTGRVLLGLRSVLCHEPRTWGLFGGAIEEGEIPEEAAVRETREEIGYHGLLGDLVPLYVFTRRSFRYYSFMTIVPREFSPRLNWENEDARWCALDRLPSPLHFGLKTLFDDPQTLRQVRRTLRLI